MNKRAVLYARVSSDDRGKDGRKLAGQLEICRDHALSKGYEIVAELAEDDRGARGSSLDLEKLNQVRDMAARGMFDVLVVREPDRFSRSLAKQLLLEEELKRSSVEVDFVLGEYSDTPEGNLNKNIKAVIAEYEATKINERKVRGRRNKIKAGHVLTCGRVAYGYRAAEVDGKTTLEIQEPEAGIVRMIFDWYTRRGVERKPIRGIAQELTRMRVPTWSGLHPGKTGRKKDSYVWSGAAVRKILINETYAGTWRYGEMVIEVPAIVPRDTWEAAQRQRAEQAPGQAQPQISVSIVRACSLWALPRGDGRPDGETGRRGISVLPLPGRATAF